MLESLLGLLTPTTRQNTGSPVNLWPVGVTSLPVETVVDVVIVVLPSNARLISAEHGRSAAIGVEPGLWPLANSTLERWRHTISWHSVTG